MNRGSRKGSTKVSRGRAMSRLALALAASWVVAELTPLGGTTARADATWVGDTSPDWNVAANWTSDPANPAGNFFVNLATGNIATLDADSAFVPNDLLIGNGGTNVGRLDHRAGGLSLANTTANGTWMVVGRGSNTAVGTYNLADTSAVGTGISGFATGSGSLTVGKLWIGGARFGENGTGTVNINTSGTITANSTQEFTNTRASISLGYAATGGTAAGTINLENGTIQANSEIWVGFNRAGTVNQSGGEVNSTEYFVVARNSGAIGTYNMTGGTVNAATGLGFAVIGSFAGATGTVNVSGGGFNVGNGAQFIVGEGGAGTLNVSGTGTVNVANAGNGLRLGANAGGVGTVNLNAGGTLQTITVTKGAGTGTFNFNGGTLRGGFTSAAFMQGLTRANVRNGGAVIDTNGWNLTVAQALEHSNIDGDAAVDGGLTKNGIGTLTLTGNNTYTGGTIVNAGTLAYTGAGTATVGATTVTDAAGLALTVGAIGTTRLTTAGLTLGSAGGNVALAYDFNNLANPTVPVVNSTGALTVGASTVTLTAANSPNLVTGTITLVDYAGPALSADDFAKFTPTLSLGGRTQGTLVNNTANTSVDLSVTKVVPVWRGNVSGEWDVAEGPGDAGGTLNFRIGGGAVATAYQESTAPGDSVLFADTYDGVNAPTTTNISITEAANPTAVTVNNSALNYTFGGSAGIGGTTALTKSGTGVLTLNSANTYTGGTVFTGGTLALGNAQGLGNGPLTIAPGAAKTLDAAGEVGTLAAVTAQAWNDDFTFAGSFNLDTGNGPVTLGGAGTTRTVTVAANTLTVGPIGGPLGLTKTGPGTLAINTLVNNTTNTSSNIGGTLTVNAGTLQINTGATGATTFDFFATGLAGTGTIVNGGGVERWLYINNPADHTFAGTLANGTGGGALGLNKSGAGSLTLTTANTYTGVTTAGGGALVMAHPQALGATSTITLAGTTGSLVFQTDGGEPAYNSNMGTGTTSTLVSDRATPGAGITHTMGTVLYGGGTINVTAGTNVTSGEAAMSFPTVGLTSGTANSTLVFNPTTARVTIGNASITQNANAKLLGLGGTNLNNTVTGAITDGITGASLGVAKSGAGTWTLSGASTYTNVTNVTAGTLVVGPTAVVNNGTTHVFSGTLDVAGAYTGTGDVWVGEGNNGVGALTVRPGATLSATVVLIGAGGSATNVATGTGTLQAGGTINTKRWFVIGQSGSAATTGTFTVDGGTLNVHTDNAVTGNLEVGTFDAAGATLNVNAGSTVRVQNNATLVFGAQGSHSGAGVVNHNGGDVTFYADGGTLVGGTGAVVLAGAGNPTGTYAYNLNGGTLTAPQVRRDATAGTATTTFNFNGGTLKATADQAAFLQGLTRANVRNGGAVIDTNGVNITIAQALEHSNVVDDAATDGGLTKKGAGTLTLTGASTYTGPTAVTAGRLTVGAGGSIATSSGVTVATGARFEAAAPQAVKSLTVGDGGTAEVSGAALKVLTTNALTVSGPTGHVDLHTNALVVDYAGASPVGGAGGIRAKIVAAFNGGDWLGKGIGSSNAVGSGGSSPLLAVGYAEGAELFGPGGGVLELGQGVNVLLDDTAVIVRTTLAGDADLNGVVGLNDLVRLANHYGTAGEWFAGDFDYNGQIGLNDLVQLANNYGQSMAALGGPAPDFAADWALAQELAAAGETGMPAQAVPEPGALGLAGLSATAALLTRRRRRQ
ncbi:MAG TPA: autotransporter-associated beta strand repeat-containing protein [Tepidisphaeraceae bacterium]|nr:autotransporter-associated beta strand repeat-containing protein [Tepidisphaeraceae bacterium]